MKKVIDDRDRYDELDNLISSIDIIISDTNSRDIIDDLENIKNSYVNEKDELEQKISKQEEAEERALNIEFERSRF